MTTRSDDRTVHGVTAHGDEIVRYDRAGKWFIEGPSSRRRVTASFAALMAFEGEHYPHKPGGQVLDAKVRALQEYAGK